MESPLLSLEILNVLVARPISVMLPFSLTLNRNTMGRYKLNIFRPLEPLRNPRQKANLEEDPHWLQKLKLVRLKKMGMQADKLIILVKAPERRTPTKFIGKLTNKFSPTYARSFGPKK